MEEQRARQEAESAASGANLAPGSPAQEGSGPATGATDPAAADAEEDPVLARALAMSVSESAEPDLSAMTEDEQIAYAMRMSMQEEASTPTAASSGEAEKMDVDEQSGDKNDEDYSEAMNDPAFLQVNCLNITQWIVF